MFTRSTPCEAYVPDLFKFYISRAPFKLKEGVLTVVSTGWRNVRVECIWVCIFVCLFIVVVCAKNMKER